MTQEQKREIYELYIDPSNKLRDIAQLYGLKQTSKVSQIAVEMGATPRRPNTFGKRLEKPTTRKCSNCKSKIAIQNAKYCPFCGADIRTDGDILIDEMMALLSKLMIIPSSERDNFQLVLLNTIEYVKRKGKK